MKKEEKQERFWIWLETRTVTQLRLYGILTGILLAVAIYQYVVLPLDRSTTEMRNRNETLAAEERAARATLANWDQLADVAQQAETLYQRAQTWFPRENDTAKITQQIVNAAQTANCRILELDSRAAPSAMSQPQQQPNQQLQQPNQQLPNQPQQQPNVQQPNVQLPTQQPIPTTTQLRLARKALPFTAQCPATQLPRLIETLANARPLIRIERFTLNALQNAQVQANFQLATYTLLDSPLSNTANSTQQQTANNKPLDK